MTDAIITSEIKLKQVLSLNDLIIYGIILIQPVAALPLFGHANNISQGHAVTSILVAMVAMIFTAISYGLIYLIDQKTGVLYARYRGGWWPQGHGIGYADSFVIEVAEFIRSIVEDVPFSSNFEVALNARKFWKLLSNRP